MIQVKGFVNSVLNSNTYVLYMEPEETAWVVDPGDTEVVLNWLSSNNKSIEGILITHAHFDHIYGINSLHHRFPNLKVYASNYAKEGMLSEKLNGSVYHEMPYVVYVNHIEIIKHGDLIPLWNNITMNVYETLGHSRDCVSFSVGKNLFTGDALIPGHKVVTKMKFGDAQLAAQSLKRIFNEFDSDMHIWPGHERDCFLSELSVDNTFVKYKQ